LTPLEFRCAVVKSAVGSLRVTEGPQGVASVELRPDALSSLRRRLERRYGRAVELREVRSLPACAELRQYFRGRRRTFGARLDLSHLPEFERRVLETLRQVPFGEVVSYGELARRAGSPDAARAVGGAMRRNVLPIFVPCHRVTAADGTLGGFTGGLEKKRWLLRLEGLKMAG
jgi:methylated-DNA-[protein]-cysteine S-methyltransferase